MNEKSYIMLTIDWEKDHGKWRYDSKEVDYGGILVGTRYLEDIMDDLGIPCTWFIETHKDYPELDIPKQFPENVIQLKNRKNDEIGTHIHWGSYNSKKKCWEYPTHDTEWVNGLIQYAKEEAADFKINPISFRGGAFLYVPHLPNLLQRNGYLIDSTFTYWDKSSKIIGQSLGSVKRLISTPPTPYFCDTVDFRKSGPSNIVEFPVYFNVIKILKYKFLAKMLSLRFRYMMNSFSFFTLYMHIDELTDPKTGPNEATNIDKNIADNLKYFLEKLNSNENVEFVTFSDAYKILKNYKKN